MGRSKHILVAPLDWGLGHTTRCIPLMRHMLAKGHAVTLAGNEAQRSFVQTVFPGIPAILLEGYGVRYGKDRTGTLLNILRQVPGIAKRIAAEHAWLDTQITAYRFDGVLSDNRYGLWTDRIPAVILTHQLHPRTGLGPVADAGAGHLLHRYLRRFSQTWIVDTETEADSLAGSLAHPASISENARYIGHLSALDSEILSPPGSGHLLVLLSGPEPQRTLLSDLLWDGVAELGKKVFFVEGKTGIHRTPSSALISHADRLPPAAISGLMRDAELVICRSGYSTLMDLRLLQKKALLIPTPGQAEQEYLAKRCARLGLHAAVSQKGLHLPSALSTVNAAGNTAFPDSFNLFRPVLDGWLASL